MKNKKFQYVISRARNRLLHDPPTIKAGFLLIEMMTAFVAFALFAVFIARYHVSIVQLGNDAQNYLRAVNVAVDALDAYAFIKNSEDNHQEVRPFCVDRTVTEFIMPQQLQTLGLSTQRLKKFKAVHVSVSWVALDGQKKSIKLQSAGVLSAAVQEGA